MAEFRFKTKQKGFTLVEILVVVLIMGVLVAIAVPKYVNATTRANQTVHDANVRTLHSAAQIYMCKAWDKKDKSDEDMQGILADYLSGGIYPENPTDSDPYTVTISADGKIEVSPGIGDYE